MLTQLVAAFLVLAIFTCIGISIVLGLAGKKAKEAKINIE
jgi:hypothetical protein